MFAPLLPVVRTVDRFEEIVVTLRNPAWARTSVVAALQPSSGQPMTATAADTSRFVAQVTSCVTPRTTIRVAATPLPLHVTVIVLLAEVEPAVPVQVPASKPLFFCVTPNGV